MNEYEAKRLENIKRNQALIHELGIKRHSLSVNSSKQPSSGAKTSHKRRRLDAKPSRVSARIAATGPRPSYNEDAELPGNVDHQHQPKKQTKSLQPARIERETIASIPQNVIPIKEVESFRQSWSSWTPVAPPPTRDEALKTFHFASHPDFTPNKSPQEVLREGCFGGSYFRPLYSRKLGTTIEGDWEELPKEWLQGLDVPKFVTSPTYDAEVNKFKVACGQSIEEWEAQGWIDHRFDVRGWFQWYCRFFMGRRCEDDDRQVSRWKKCVGDRGRWRRMLLKKYVALGVRECFDDGEEGEDTPEVSPVIHQTCHHWAFEVRQQVLDEFWSSG